MLGEIVGEILGGVIKVIGRILVEVIVELCVKGVGYFVCRQFSRRVNPDGFWVCVVGLMVWLPIFVLAYLGYEYLSVG